MKKSLSKIKAVLFFVILAIDILLAVFLIDIGRSDKFFVSFLNVGQGDATFINMPGSVRVFIDGGPGSDVLSGVGSRIPFFDKKIDIILLSHYDIDHFRGALSILEKYDVSAVVGPDFDRKTPETEELKRLMKEKNIVFVPASYGRRIVFDNGAFIDLVVPENENSKKYNNYSVVAKLVYGNSSFIFTGDAERDQEKEMLKEGFNLDSDVLKVGHHGSRTSTSEDFFNAVSPAYSIISVGAENRYGHPHDETLRRLFGTQILRTDISGDITFLSDGKNVYLAR